MKNKLVFRILGALASSLMIVGVFVPFYNLNNYSFSLWQIYSEQIYLPIILIIFGVIGIIFFAINNKSEFAYMSVGGVGFYTISQTIGAINNESFSSLGIGYYLLLVGVVVTLVMNIICNINKKVVNTNTTENNSTSNNVPILNKINDLYDNNENNVMTNTVSNVLSNKIPMNQFNTSLSIPTNPVNEFSAPASTPTTQVNEFSTPVSTPTNPVNEFSTPASTPTNPVNEFSAPVSTPTNPVNEFSTPVSVPTNPVNNITAVPNSVPLNSENPNINEEKFNPVVNEFMNPTSVPANPNKGQVDIFGQPIK